MDKNGLTTSKHAWSPIADARGFDAARWLEPRAASDFDDEQIGLLTVPPPDLGDLGRDLVLHYDWLVDLSAEERVVAKGNAGDRGGVIEALRNLDGRRMLTEL